MSQEKDLPLEPGEVEDPTFGVNNDMAGNPSLEPPENDQEIGDREQEEDEDGEA